MTRWILPMVVLLSMWSAQAWATTRYMATTGNDSNSCATSATITTPKLTIASALACMAAGDTLYIRSGTYNQIFNLGTMHGTAGNPLTIAGYPGETVTITGVSGNEVWMSYVTNSVASVVNYITFQHLIFDLSAMSSESQDTGNIPDLNAVHDWIFDDVEMKNCHCVFLLINHNSYNITVRNSRFHHNSTNNPTPGYRYYAIYLHDGHDNLFENNEFDHNVGAAMQIYPGPNSNVTVRNNRLHDNNAPLISGNHGGGLTLSTDGSACSNVQIYNNQIYNNGSGTTHGDATGIFINGGFNCAKIYNNTIYNNAGFSDGTGGGWGVRLESTAGSGNIITNNLIVGNQSVSILNDAASTVLTTNRTSGVITDCVTSSSDFSLKAGTNPCVDTGTTVSAVTTDYLGTARPQGVAYDIGAYERIGNSGGGGGGGGGSAACTNIASDTFNRAAGALGANWQANTTADVLVIRSPNVAQATIANYGSDALSSWIGAGTFTDDQCADVTLATSNTAGNYSAGYGPAVRVSPTVNTHTGYSFIVGTLGWELRRDVAGSFLSLAHNTTPAFNTGDVAQLIVSGSSPPLLAMNRNGTALDLSTATVCGSCVKSGNTVTDGNASAITTGIPGISYSSSTQNLIDTPTVGIASWAGSSYVSSDVTIPTVPTGLTVTPNLPNQLLVSWTASTDDVAVVNYTLQACTPHSCSNFATISTTASVSFTHTGLPNNTVYAYQVRANDGAGNSSAYTAAVEGTTLPSTQVPVISNPIPTGTAVVDASPITISVNTDIPAVCKYNTRTQGTAAYASLTHTMTANALVNSASVTPDQHGSNSGVNHFYIACDNAASIGHASATTDMTFTMIAPGDATKPSTITNLTVNALDAVRIQLNWTAATDNTAVTGYNAYCSSGIGTPIVTYNTDPVNATPALVVGAVNTSAILTRTLGVVYNCVVDAFDAAGNIALDSNIATAQTFAPLSPPTLLHEVGPASNNVITVIWNPSTDQNAAGYNVYQSTTAGVIGQLVQQITGAWAIAHHTTMTQFTTVVSTGATYYFTITATDASGAESLGSNQLAVVRTGPVARTLRVP